MTRVVSPAVIKMEVVLSEKRLASAEIIYTVGKIQQTKKQNVMPSTMYVRSGEQKDVIYKMRCVRTHIRQI